MSDALRAMASGRARTRWCLAVATVLALLGTVALLARYAGLAAEQRTYEQAPGCETVTVTRHVSCRYGMSATVTAIDRYGRKATGTC